MINAAVTDSKWRFTTKDILTIAVIAAICGVVGAFVVGPWAKFIEGLLGPFGAALDNPFFIFWAILAGLLIPRPGVALVTSLLGCLVEMIAGSLDGSIVMVFGLAQGIGMEAGLALFRYRPSLPAAIVSGALGGVGCAISLLYVFGFVTLPGFSQILLIAALAIGDGVIGGLLAWFIAQAVKRSGAFS
jgi:energy-coupling factor transport system substrate-specific component